jgi:D-alanyl-D-alanine carboxypeptidase
VTTVTAAQLGATWHPGCPVAASQLRTLKMSYVGFNGRTHLGTMVVNISVATSVIRVFKLLYQAAFPIKEMIPESAYHGDDNTAAAADDTSGFNCRYAVAAGPPRWSVHAYGEAIDVNDVQNPYIDGTTVIPPTGASYRDRSDVRPGMAILHGTLVDAFAIIGWQWGGRWTATPDYQHFSLTGG